MHGRNVMGIAWVSLEEAALGVLAATVSHQHHVQAPMAGTHLSAYIFALFPFAMHFQDAVSRSSSTQKSKLEEQV